MGEINRILVHLTMTREDEKNGASVRGKVFILRLVRVLQHSGCTYYTFSKLEHALSVTWREALYYTEIQSETTMHGR